MDDWWKKNSAPIKSLFVHVSPRQRAIRRVESASRNEKESLRIRACAREHRESVRADQIARSYFEERELLESRSMQVQRWKIKLTASPLRRDLVHEDLERSRSLAVSEAKRRRARSEQTETERRIHSAVLHASSEASPDETLMLRLAKRDLMLASRQLRAMKDVARTNARIFSIRSGID